MNIQWILFTAQWWLPSSQ